MSKDPIASYYKNNSLQQLRGFCYAAQFGNISRAAEHMRLTQSSVSLQIKALEEYMGCILFERRGPRISLTEDGQKLLDRALPLIDSIQSLREEFHEDVRDRVNNELRIAVNASTKNFLMPPVLSEYIKHHPSIRIVLHYVEHPEAMELLAKEQVDIAVLARHDHMPFPSSCEYIPVYYCNPCLITLPDHPLAGKSNLLVSEINRYPLVLPTKEMQIIPNLRETFERGADNNRCPIDFINSDTFKEYVEAGIVITILPDIWIRERDHLVATPLSHLFPDIDYGMVRLRKKPMPKKARDLLDTMRQQAHKRQDKSQLHGRAKQR